MALQTADEKVVPEWSRQTRKQWDIKRLSAVNLESVDVLGVVAVDDAAAQRRRQPVVAVAKGKLMV